MATKGKRLVVFLITTALALIGAAIWRINRVPEPSLNGVPLGTYLADSRFESDLQRIASNFGARAVPYLAQQIQRDRVRELLHKALARVPFQKDFLASDIKNYNRRRFIALHLLYELNTNALSCFPDILDVAENPDDPAFSTALLSLRIAPGTEHELRALHALIAATATSRPMRSFAFERQYAFSILPSFTNHPDVVLPALVASLHEPGGYKRIDAVLSFGTNAFPALQDLSRRETNHVRPATLALEQLLARK